MTPKPKRRETTKKNDIIVEVPSKPAKTPKPKVTKVKNTIEKPIDEEVIAAIRQMTVPLGLVVRHGAAFESQAKRAIKKVYSEGRDYRKNITPIAKVKTPTTSTAKFSHALVVSGYLGKIPCERLVIDPGCSISMIDVRTARKGPLELNRDSHLTFHLANGELAKPIGETKQRQTITVEGIQVSLKMPVVDSRDSYDILLGRDWLHAVNAVARYAKNQYKISKDGKQAKLQGRIYTQHEVELGSSSSDSSDTEDDSETDSDSDSDSDDENIQEKEEVEDSGSDDGMHDQYLATCLLLDDLDIKPPVEEELKVARREEDAILPLRMTQDSAGYDLFASKEVIIKTHSQALVPTGISLDIPEGCYGQIKPRSGLALKKQITTDAGVIDRDYRGEIAVLLVNHGDHDFLVQAGDRIAQIILTKIATPDVTEVSLEELGGTE